MAFTINRAGW